MSSSQGGDKSQSIDKLREDYRAAWEKYDLALQQFDQYQDSHPDFDAAKSLQKLYEDCVCVAESLTEATADPEATLVVAREYLFRCQQAYDAYLEKHSKKALAHYEKQIEYYLPRVLDVINQSEDTGDGELYYILAHIYDGPYYIPETYHSRAEAFRYYRKAAENGDAAASMRLAELAERWTGTDKGRLQYLRLLQRAVRRGNTEAMLTLGRHYFEGTYVGQDYNEAYQLFMDGLRQLDSDIHVEMYVQAELQYRLALCQFYGLGVKTDKEKAIDTMMQAATFNSEADAFVRHWKKGDLESRWKPLSSRKDTNKKPQKKGRQENPMHYYADEKAKQENGKDKESGGSSDQSAGDDNPMRFFADKNHKAYIYEDDPSAAFFPHFDIDDFLEMHGYGKTRPGGFAGNRDEYKEKRPLPDLNDEEIEEMLKPLDDLVGLRNVKKEVRNLVSLMKARKLREDQGLETPGLNMHMVFMGPPGTGKTTVARILGEIFTRMGYLDHGHVVEVDHTDLIGEYVGQTGPKTSARIEQAMGGILFIDEAYMLTHDDYFGPEAIATILKKMEDHRDNFVVIAAGYTNEMKGFLNANTGLKSRFSNVIEFDAYSAEELVSIFNTMCEQASYKPTEEALKRVREMLKRSKRNETISISNARGVRDIMEKTIRKQSLRIANAGETDKESLMEIRREDIYSPDNDREQNVIFLGDKD